jgi:hypothetical protein
MRRTSVLAALVLATFTGAISCDDDDITGLEDEDYTATLNVAQEEPDPTGNPTATGTATMELEDGVLTVTVVVNGQLTSDVTMAHIHGPAAAGQIGPIILDFVPSMTTVINAGTRTGTIVSASFDLETLTVSATGVLRVEPAVLIAHLNAGNAYVNVHTETNPTGEIRGQIARD